MYVHAVPLGSSARIESDKNSYLELYLTNQTKPSSISQFQNYLDNSKNYYLELHSINLTKPLSP